MRTLLLLGAGRSSTALIRYLLGKADAEGFRLVVAEQELAMAEAKLGGHPAGRALSLNAEDADARVNAIRQSDLVISLLPPHLHPLAANDCLAEGKHLLTASYVSPELQGMDRAVRNKGLLFLCECGLDPGIDHLSAMEIIDRLRNQGATLTGFQSYCGGLIAPESSDNPWGYKFTWNPRNVILAGQGTARYIQNGHYHYIPYPRLFAESVRIDVPGAGRYDGYANRDSLAYRKAYGLETIPTLLRGTLRNEGFCSAWQVFVKLGLTDDSFKVEQSATMTYRQLVEAFIPPSTFGTELEERLTRFCAIDPEGPSMERIRSTGILEDKLIGLIDATPAQILQHLLEQRWKLKPGDKDLIVMQHLFDYELNGKAHTLRSSLVVKGDDEHFTAMAKTVGLPLGIAAVNLLRGKFNQHSGVLIPVHRDFYQPILRELAEEGIRFAETES